MKANNSQFKGSKKLDLAGVLSEFMKVLTDSENYYSSIAKVLSVDEIEKTCDVQIINGASVEGVRLQQVASDTGLFIKPSVNSIVILSWTDKTTAYVSMFSQIDEIIFQDGVNGGLIKIADLVTRLNDLEGLFNTLQNNFNTWVPAPTDGGTALKTVLSSGFLIETVPDSQVSDFENEKFKH